MKYIYFLLTISFFVVLASSLEQCAHEPDALCFDPTCAQPLFDKHAGIACECNDDNIGTKFLDCVNGTRKMIYFWRPPATCINGTLPLPVEGIPCDVHCDAGQHLDLATMACKNCSKGTFSVGPGHKWDTWQEWPAQFSTHCAIGTPNQNCSAWRLAGEYIDSGNNFNSAYLESVLELRIYLIVDGYVSFQYMVSAEAGYDGMWFVVDDLAYFFQSNAPWTTYKRTLTAGYHTISWQYYKDRTVSSGSDRASIRSIEVLGTTLAQVSCEECPLGHYQDQEGQTYCKDCPAETFNGDTPGASQCTPCPEWGYSFPGATYCIPKRTCNTSADITWAYTDCVKNERTKYYSWVPPTSCDVETSSLPDNVTESCNATSTCKQGQEPVNGKCVYCDAGAFSDGNNECVPCAEGQSADLRVRYFDDWSSWPTDTGVWSTSCSGNCYTSGWRLGNWFIDSGLGHGPNTVISAQLDVNVYRGARIQFQYSVPANPDDLLIFYINNNRFAVFKGDNCSNTMHTFNRRLPIFGADSAALSLMWAFVKSADTTYSDCDRAIITSINITGVADGVGGASTCVNCAAGSYSPNTGSDRCSPCAAGQYSLPKATECLTCMNGTITERPGTGTCVACGSGTTPDEDNHACMYNCSTITFPRDNGEVTTYDLSSFDTAWNVSFGSVDYFGSICSINPSCGDSDTHICLDYPNVTFGFGLLDAGHFVNITEIDGHKGVQFTFTHGDSLGFGSNVTCSTNVHLLCDPTLSSPAPIVSDSSNFDSSCVIYFAWSARNACPKCTAEDYTYLDGKCKDGYASRKYFWLNSYCVGGADLPSTTTVECPTDVSFKQRTVVIASVLGSVFFVGAVAGIVMLYYRNKKLSVAYNSLRSNTIPLDSDSVQDLQKD